MLKELSLQNALIDDFCSNCIAYNQLQKAIVQTQFDKDLTHIIDAFNDDTFNQNVARLVDMAHTLDKENGNDNKIEEVIQLIFEKAYYKVQGLYFEIQRFLLMYKLNSIDLSHRNDISLTPIDCVHTLKSKDKTTTEVTYTTYCIHIIETPSNVKKENYDGVYENSYTFNMYMPLVLHNENIESCKHITIINTDKEGEDVNTHTMYINDDLNIDEKKEIYDKVEQFKKTLIKKRKKKKDVDENIPGGTA